MFGDIFLELKHLEKELKELFSLYPKGELHTFYPPVDIFEKDGRMVIYVDLPGFTREDLKVEVKGKYLIIKGLKRIDRMEGKGLNFLCLERRFGNFERRILLGRIPDTENIKALLSKGVLKIEIPMLKDEEKQIEIRIKEEE